MKIFCGTFLVLCGALVFADDARVIEQGSDKTVTVECVSVEARRIDPGVLAVPLRLNYQGFLTDNSGNAIDDTATMIFRVFTASSGGTQLWSSGDQLLDVVDGVFHTVLASVPMSVFEAGDTRWLELAVRGEILSPRTEITSVAWAYVATLADSADGSARIGGQTLAALDGRYINDGESAGNDLSGTYPNPAVVRIQTRPVSSAAPSVGQILKWDGSQWALANDTAGGADNDWIISGSNMYSGVSGNVGVGISSPQTKLHVSGIICGGVSSTVGAIYGAVLGGYGNTAGDAAVDTGAVICGGRNNAAISRYSTIGGGRDNAASDYATTVAGGYGNLASNSYAIVGGGRGNTATGTYSTVTGGYNNYALSSSMVGGGQADSAKGMYAGIIAGYSNLAGDAYTDTGAVVCGGVDNAATEKYSLVGGGLENVASAYASTIAGGYSSTASGTYSTVAGGSNNTSSNMGTTVAGGRGNAASASDAVVSGGVGNVASGVQATVGGGYWNNAAGYNTTVAGGYDNYAGNSGATVGGGAYDTSAASYSYTVGYNSVVLSGHNGSAAFNGQTSTASGQTRVGALSKASGTFTIDHPLDPVNKILNHYFVESPEMVLIYRGVAVIGSGGRAEVQLPDYYDALNRNSQIQLTGVGTYEVFIAENVRNNRFVIGGKPGTEVHWVVTSERKDQSAEITKIIMPVEQTKDGDLAGRSLDDDFLVSTKEQLERMGKASGFNFRLPSNQQRYDEMKRMITENR